MRSFWIAIVLFAAPLSAQTVTRLPDQQPFALEVREGRVEERTANQRQAYFQRQNGIFREQTEEVVVPPDSANAGSSLQRVTFMINFDDSPVQIIDASANFTSLSEIGYNCIRDGELDNAGFFERLFNTLPDCDVYADTFIQMFMSDISTTSTVAAIEIRYLTFDLFGDRLRDVRAVIREDFSGNRLMSTVLGNSDDIHSHLTTVAFINRVTLLDGSVWKVDEYRLTDTINNVLSFDGELDSQTDPDISVPLERDTAVIG